MPTYHFEWQIEQKGEHWWLRITTTTEPWSTWTSPDSPLQATDGTKASREAYQRVREFIEACLPDSTPEFHRSPPSFTVRGT